MDNGHQRGKAPQEKKALSYAKDRRNDYGDNDKSSRKNIPRHKARQRRHARRQVGQALWAIDRLDDEAAAVVESSVRQELERVGGDGWRKHPDMPLGLYLERRARWRQN